jgi:branched-subunit amino acid aminotransferase/4-amino-4-deoxychorismate lyase
VTVPLAFRNGRLIPAHGATLPVHDAGLVSGVTVTDFCRTFRQRLYRWPDHLARFRRDCAACFIELPHADEALTAAAHELIAHNALLLPAGGELALTTFATPGPVGLYAGEPGRDGPPTLVMHTFGLPLPRYAPFFQQGVSLAVAGHHAAHPDDLAPPAVKHRSRLHWWRADRLLRRRGDVPAGAVALLLDAPGGAVTETAIGHVLLVRGGTVVAPPAGTVLDGISLRVVRELCAALGMPYAEQRLTLSDARGAEEAMLTGTAFCLAGVRWLEGVELPWPGPVTRRLLAAWSEAVGVDIAGQFLA